jgi:hypothetical protein
MNEGMYAATSTDPVRSSNVDIEIRVVAVADKSLCVETDSNNCCC